jgi:hypothetical protein
MVIVVVYTHARRLRGLAQHMMFLPSEAHFRAAVRSALW